MISICLRNPDKLIDVEAAEVFSEHFGVPGHKYIFIAMMYLYSRKETPNPMAILEVLGNDKAKKSVEELGGLEYLTILEESPIPVDNLEFFIDKIKQSYTRRMLLNISNNVKDFVMSDRAEVLNPSELIEYAETKLTDLSVNVTTTDEVYKMGKDTERVLALRAENPCQVPGLEVGWKEFDAVTNGGQPGDLIIVCAESKTGKSVCLTNWATQFSILGKLPVLYIDTEMNEREQEDRILASLTGIPADEIISGRYVLDTVSGKADDKIARLKSARELLTSGYYYHIYMPHFTMEKVAAISRKFTAQYGIKALFFDYIKIPSTQTGMRSLQEYQALGFFTSGLKDLAGLLKIPVYAACQANREDLNTQNPNASNIGGSYRILQLASKLMFLINKHPDRIAKEGIRNGNQQIIIKYQRNGMSDVPPINIMFDKPILRMSEV